jgi:hypothetical protein
MSKRIREHLRSNVVGYVAIFLFAVGGTAYATHPGGANTISTGDIINGEVKTADLGDGEVRNPDLGADSVASGKIQDRQVKNADLGLGASSSNTIADGGILNVDVANDTLTGAKVNNNSLTGDDVDENSLNLATEAWHEVGAAGEPGFNNSGFCTWSNFDANHNSAAFLRDREGIVHLKGLVDADDVIVDGCSFGFAADRLIYTLPAGYRPAAREVNVSLSNNALARVNVDSNTSPFGEGPGAVAVDAPTTTANGKEWLSLDGISFRCAPSGVNGCP